MQVVSLVVVHHVSQSCQVVVSRQLSLSVLVQQLVQSYVKVPVFPSSWRWWRTSVGATECELCSRLFPLQNRHQFVDVRMATADGFVHPAVPSLDNVVR